MRVRAAGRQRRSGGRVINDEGLLAVGGLSTRDPWARPCAAHSVISRTGITLMKPYEPERMRIREIVERLRTDPDFHNEVRNNPHRVLADAGLEPDDIADLARGFGRKPDPDTQMYCKWTCIKETSECTKSYLV
jgi:hypothetical protein